MHEYSRRRLLELSLRGAAGLGLLSAVQGAPALAARASSARALPGFGRAKRCIFLFMFGGPSQMDLFDHKPELQRRGGQTVDLERRVGQVRESVLLASERSFARHGETGQWCSDALPHVAEQMDKLAVIKSLKTDSFAHGSAILKLNSGEIRQGFPSLGSWVSYGLGSDNSALPSFVVMHDPRGGPISGPANWSSGFIPAEHQGTLFRSTGDPVLDLSPSISNVRRDLPTAARLDQLALLDDADDVTQVGHLQQDVRADQNRLAHQVQLFEQLPHLDPGAGVDEPVGEPQAAGVVEGPAVRRARGDQGHQHPGARAALHGQDQATEARHADPLGRGGRGRRGQGRHPQADLEVRRELGGGADGQGGEEQGGGHRSAGCGRGARAPSLSRIGPREQRS